MTRRERGITRLSVRWGCAASVGGGGATLSRPPSSVSFSVDAAGSGSSVSLFFLVDDHLAASRSECLLLRVCPLETRGGLFRRVRTLAGCGFETRVENDRRCSSWRLVESVINGLDSARRSEQ